MKTEKQKDAPWILSILIISGFVLMALFFLLYTPVDFLRYCERVVFLVKEKGYSGEERALVEKADFILLYNEKDFADRVNRFLREQAIV